MERETVAHVRAASLADGDLFEELWKEFVTQQRTVGGDVLPTKKTMDFYRSVFDSYTLGLSQGIVVIGALDNAVLLWGQPQGELPWDHTLGKWAMGWGTYVRSDFQRQGWGTLMRSAAVEVLRGMDFDSILGGPWPQNEAGLLTWLKFGAEPYQNNYVVRL